MWLNDVLINKSYFFVERKVRLLDFKFFLDFIKVYFIMDYFFFFVMICVVVEYGLGKFIYLEFVRFLFNEYYIF